MPADFMASILESASPLPPEMIAPAWPMRRPGGAVTPGDEADHRLLAPWLRLDEVGGVFLGGAADLADHDDRLRSSGSRQEHLQHVDEVRCP